MFSLSFSDADEVQNKGAAAIVFGLEIMNGKGQEFAPKDQVSRAEAAIVIMRMVGLQGKLDMPIPSRGGHPYY
jgi:hypothetical protein